MLPILSPIALTIAGSASSGGAGIQADLKTFTAIGVYGASVITAITAQNTQGVQGVFCLPQEIIAQQMRSVASDLVVGGIKTGMLGDRATVETVTAGLAALAGVPVVVDPVIVATGGDVLLADDAIDAVRTHLLPCAAVITPNLREAARLLETQVATSIADMEDQTRPLLAFGAKAVLLKGGHGEGPAGTPGVHRGVADHAADALVAAGARWRARTLARALATPGQLAEIQPWDVGTTGRTSIEPPARSVGMRPAIANARRCPGDDS